MLDANSATTRQPTAVATCMSPESLVSTTSASAAAGRSPRSGWSVRSDRSLRTPSTDGATDFRVLRRSRSPACPAFAQRAVGSLDVVVSGPALAGRCSAPGQSARSGALRGMSRTSAALEPASRHRCATTDWVTETEAACRAGTRAQRSDRRAAAGQPYRAGGGRSAGRTVARRRTRCATECRRATGRESGLERIGRSDRLRVPAPRQFARDASPRTQSKLAMRERCRNHIGGLRHPFVRRGDPWRGRPIRCRARVAPASSVNSGWLMIASPIHTERDDQDAAQ